ncbi:MULTISPECIES: hypothetical protein [unclassified Novosphingobium]|uniref:hypothetical protein n=1 Tax=unclassified Novosphingobium TaxID=2644732 RepID=UPI0006C86AD4|nr:MULTISPECIES: hypothetical protein [unclassified Novosphingobium]KPH60590.1 hypothetical protein ADT71_19030 [Novosphingobium sp. ST904]MPS67792.1 hypothetical protein [Novosphingobium sp.]TCM39420.1 hypothetical protein EDF59_106307 [Novosphingobium sp. ST904]
MAQEDRIGALVGWSSRNLGPNILLELQTFEKSGWESHEDPEHSRILMTRSQAAVLANHLLQVSGTQPPRRKGWLGSLFD